MALPVVKFVEIQDGITVSTTTQFHIVDGMFMFAKSVILEIVGASTPNWTVDIQGKVHGDGTYDNWTYRRIGSVMRSEATTDQISVTDTTRRYYKVIDPPPYLQVVSTRTGGSLTVRAASSSASDGEYFAALMARNAPDDALGNSNVLTDADASAITGLTRAQMVFAILQGWSNEANRWTNIRSAASNADALAAVGGGNSLFPLPSLFNGSTFDRERGVVETDNYIAASLVSATQNGADRTNYNFRGLAIFVDVTARNGTSTITIALQTKDGNGNYDTIWTAAAALSATGQAQYLIYPTAENTESWTEMANTVLGARTYRVIATYGGADTISFDVDVVELL